MGVRGGPERRLRSGKRTDRVQSGRADWQESRIPHDEGTPRIAPWLNAQTAFKRARHLGQSHVHAAQTSVVGGLRLLVQKWTKQDGILDSDTPIMPFLKADFDLITEQLCLPRSFPLDFARCQQIPAEVKHISTRYGKRLGWFTVDVFPQKY